MADATEESNNEKRNPSLDLSGLSSISLGPDWGSGDKPRSHMPKERRDDRRDDRSRSRPPQKRDRRGDLPQRRDAPERSRSEHRPSQQRTRQPAEPFSPVVMADFYPEEEPFKVLTQAIKTSHRTYELFEIARLILDKPERWVCVVKDPAQKEGDVAKLYASVPDGLPFRTEEDALSHVFRHYLDHFFTMEDVEVDPPKGTFQVIHKCGITGELLSPPNFHRYQALCRAHHASSLAHLPYAKFEERIESVRDEEVIASWLEKMKKQTRFHPKDEENLTIETLEDARLYLLTKDKEKLVRPAYSARFSGKALSLLNPGDPIRRSVEYLLEGQKRFPLDTANHLRGRLRRSNFNVYKKGSKGVSYVCGVKRRFRKPDEVLTDSLQELLDFVEAHPNYPAKDLPKSFLGIDLSKKKANQETEVDEETKQVAQELSQPAGDEVTETTEASAPVTESAVSAAAADESAKAAIQKAEDIALNGLKRDLRYLISEGYMIEYSDGRLFVPPVREEDIRRLEKKKAKPEGTNKPGQEKKASAEKKEPATEAKAEAVETEQNETAAVLEKEEATSEVTKPSEVSNEESAPEEVSDPTPTVQSEQTEAENLESPTTAEEPARDK